MKYSFLLYFMICRSYSSETADLPPFFPVFFNFHQVDLYGSSSKPTQNRSQRRQMEYIDYGYIDFSLWIPPWYFLIRSPAPFQILKISHTLDVEGPNFRTRAQRETRYPPNRSLGCLSQCITKKNHENPRDPSQIPIQSVRTTVIFGKIT